MDWVMYVQCCDKRFQVASQKLRKHLGLKKGNYDPISVPGGAANLMVIKDSFKLLCPIRPEKRLVVLTIHEDCAAGATPEDLARAIEEAKKFFFQGKAYILRLDGSFEMNYSWHSAVPALTLEA